VSSVLIYFLFLIITTAINTFLTKEARSYDVGFIIATEKEERYKKDKKFFLEEAKSLGLSVFFGSSDNDQERQNEQVLKAVREGVKVIVIQPVDSFGAKKAIQIVKPHKIKIIAYDRIIYDAYIDYYITHDSVLVGILQSRECTKFSGEKGNVVILSGGKNHSVAKQITTGNLMILEKIPNIKILGIFYHENWDESESYITIKEILKKNSDLRCIIANNSSLARGAIKALEENSINPKDIFIAGADADLENIKLLIQGKQKVEILKDIEPLARTAARVSYDIIKGKNPDFQDVLNNGKVDVKVIKIPVELITKENIDLLIKRGFHKKEDIYGK